MLVIAVNHGVDIVSTLKLTLITQYAFVVEVVIELRAASVLQGAIDLRADLCEFKFLVIPSTYPLFVGAVDEQSLYGVGLVAIVSAYRQPRGYKAQVELGGKLCINVCHRVLVIAHSVDDRPRRNRFRLGYDHLTASDFARFGVLDQRRGRPVVIRRERKKAIPDTICKSVPVAAVGQFHG